MRLNIYPVRIHNGLVVYEESWESMLKEMRGHIYIFPEDYLREKFKDNKFVLMNMDNTFYPPLTLEIESGWGDIIKIELQ